METPKFNCQRANQIDLVDYLQSLGHLPKKVQGSEYWFLSPLREEKTASFKVNKSRNIWYDHGIGKGGDLVDFGVLYHHCTIPELLSRLFQHEIAPPLSFQQPLASDLVGAGEKKGFSDGKIVVLHARPISAQPLIEYFESRKIPLDIAAQFCQEVDFLLHAKQQSAIGFANRAGGYELRSEYFKGSSSPKDITFFDSKKDEVSVFEGFFDYLSFLTLTRDNQGHPRNSIVLNSLAFLERNRLLMEQHNRIQLYLDRDAAGRSYTAQALHWDKEKYVDRSSFYWDHKDLNEWLVNKLSPARQSQTRRRGRSL